MKILIINLPRKQKPYSVTREGRCETISKTRVDTPTNLLIIASLLRELNHQITFIDANGFKLDYNYISKQIKKRNFDCIIFSFNSRLIEHDLKICSIAKNLNSSCITIGFSWIVRAFAKEILTNYHNLDIQIIEDPLYVIDDLIKCISEKGDLTNVGGITYRDKNNQIIINPEIKSRKSFEDFPIPAYDLLPSFKPYHINSPLLSPYALVYAGKGCPFSCKYCKMANTKYSARSANNIIRELKILKKLGDIKFVWFFDEIFTLNRKRVIEICKGMIREGLNIKWFCDTRVDLVDKELLKIMKKAGCIGIAYGVETGSQKILNSMNKGITIEQAKKTLKWTRKVRILIQLNLMLGYIGESRKTLKETENFIKTVLPEILQVSLIGPIPGTDFYKIALKNKWLKRNLHSKECFKIYSLTRKSYEPFNLDLIQQSQKLHKILFHNPKWWLIMILSLIRNYILILPIIEIFLRKIRTHESILKNINARQ